MSNILDRIPLDPKLVTTVVTTIVARIVLALGLNTEDPFVESVLSLLVGAVVGYFTPNTETILRTVQEDGSAAISPQVEQDFSLGAGDDPDLDAEGVAQ